MKRFLSPLLPVLAAFAQLPAASDPPPKARLSEFNMGTVISEPKIEQKDLEGKVVVLEFWGRH